MGASRTAPAAADPRARRGPRAAWSLVDQGLSAATNALLAFLVARAVDASEFGAFSVAFLMFGVVVGVERALIGTPLGIRHSGVSGHQRQAVLREALGAALALALVASLACAAVGLLLRGALGSSLLALAVVLPALVLQDAGRMALFAWARPRRAALSDAVWAGAQLVLVGAVLRLTQGGAAALVLAWGLAAVPASAVALGPLGARPRASRALAWLRGHRAMAAHLLGEYAMGVGALQVGVLVIGGLLGLDDIGALRAAAVLLGPLGVVSSAAVAFGVPEVARRGSLPPRPMLVALGLSATMGAVAAVYTVLLLLVPQQAGLALLGDTWAGASVVLLPIALASVAAGGKLGPVVLVYGRGATARSVRLVAVFAVLVLAAMAAGAALAGVEGMAWGLVVAQAAVVPLWFGLARRLTREERADA